MTIIKTIRDHIKKCPYLEEYNGALKIGVDYLSENTTTYSIEEEPSNPVIFEYIDGSKKKRFSFIFCSREIYGEDTKQNLDNSGFYEDFSRWLECTPVIMDSNREFIKCRATTQGYAFDVKEGKAQYQIQCELIYNEGVECIG